MSPSLPSKTLYAVLWIALLVDLTLLPALLLKLDRDPTPKSAPEELSHVPVTAK